MLARIPGKCFNGFNDEMKTLALLEGAGWKISEKGMASGLRLFYPGSRHFCQCSPDHHTPMFIHLGQLNKYASLNYFKVA